MTADNKSEVLHIQKIPNQKEFDAREAAWKVYARTSAFLHDTAVRMDVCVRMIRDPLSCEENNAVLVKHMLGELIAIKTDANEQVPDQYRPVLNGIYQYFLNEVLWYSKVDEMVYPLQYELFKLACKEDHETAEEHSDEKEKQVPSKTKTQYPCLYDDLVYCAAAPSAPDVDDVERFKKEVCAKCRAGKCLLLSQSSVDCPHGSFAANRCGDCELRPRRPVEEYEKYFRRHSGGKKTADQTEKEAKELETQTKNQSEPTEEVSDTEEEHSDDEEKENEESCTN